MRNGNSLPGKWGSGKRGASIIALALLAALAAIGGFFVFGSLKSPVAKQTSARPTVVVIAQAPATPQPPANTPLPAAAIAPQLVITATQPVPTSPAELFDPGPAPTGLPADIPTSEAVPTSPVATPQAEAQVQAAKSPANPGTNPPARPTPQPAKPPAKKKPGDIILPNGVRYGDHTPDLPGRVVRVASPNIKLDAKVYEVYGINGKWEVADYAGGHNYNAANPSEGGNIVISGHNNWRGEVFRYLEFFKPGDEIDVWTLEGKEYKYRVEQVEKLKEAGAPYAQRLQNAKVMDPTPYEQLTLITCWPYTTFTHRLIVIAKPMQ